MGAAASITHLYHEGITWFRMYMDNETYVQDFKSIDADEDGGISFMELQTWITTKASTDGGIYHILSLHAPIVTIAHKTASTNSDAKSAHFPGKQIGLAEFRALLIHMYTMSILWQHFESADTWAVSALSPSVGHKQLNREKFALACKTFCDAHACERLTPEQINSDFDILDVSNNNIIGFPEVCNYCCQFINPFFNPENATRPPLRASLDGSNNHSSLPKFFGVMEGPITEVYQELEHGNREYYQGQTPQQKTKEAFRVMGDKVVHEHHLATFIKSQYRPVNIRASVQAGEGLPTSPRGEEARGAAASSPSVVGPPPAVSITPEGSSSATATAESTAAPAPTEASAATA